MSPREITVNGIAIPPDAIAREAQYHAASSWEQACEEASRALVVRELLLQEAEAQGLAERDVRSTEAAAQAAIDRVTRAAVRVPPVAPADCEAFYHEHRERFRSPDLLEVSHILFARAADETDLAGARWRAEQILAELRHSPQRFGALARRESACPSATRDGSLGQTAIGELDPAVEAACATLAAGELAPEPVQTPHGWHVVRLDARAPGALAPYAQVRSRIEIYLRDRAWRLQLKRYLTTLADRAEIRGQRLAG